MDKPGMIARGWWLLFHPDQLGRFEFSQQYIVINIDRKSQDLLSS